jgi:hypothetical protein
VALRMGMAVVDSSVTHPTHGRLGKPVVALLGRLGVEPAGAAGLGTVSKSAYTPSAPRERRVVQLCHVSESFGTAGESDWPGISAEL